MPVTRGEVGEAGSRGQGLRSALFTGNDNIISNGSRKYRSPDRESGCQHGAGRADADRGAEPNRELCANLI